MARTIKEIQTAIHSDLAVQREGRPELSPSNTAEWRLWTWVVAAGIHAFEVIHDQFRDEIDEAADKIIPGTVRWYVEQCKRFQNGHELLFDENTAQLYYAVDDPAARIIDVVAVTEGKERLSIKVAKLDDQGRIVPLTADELHNFTGYVDSIKFAGIETVTVSTNADRVRYNVEVYYDPAVPMTTVRDRVTAALDAFRNEQDFNSMLYRQKFVAAIMAVAGVVTADLKSMERKGTSMEEFEACDVAEELEAGYFDYTDDCTLTMTSSKTV